MVIFFLSIHRIWSYGKLVLKMGNLKSWTCNVVFGFTLLNVFLFSIEKLAKCFKMRSMFLLDVSSMFTTIWPHSAFEIRSMRQNVALRYRFDAPYRNDSRWYFAVRHFLLVYFLHEKLLQKRSLSYILKILQFNSPSISKSMYDFIWYFKLKLKSGKSPVKSSMKHSSKNYTQR